MRAMNEGLKARLNLLVGRSLTIESGFQPSLYFRHHTRGVAPGCVDAAPLALSMQINSL